MNADRALALAAGLHRGQLDADGKPLIDHVRRVAAAVPPDARVVAWLHEVLERTSTSEQTLLAEGLSHAELRALRLLTRDRSSLSTASYLGHVELIARARGEGGSLARAVKRADLRDRLLTVEAGPPDGRPPYELALEVLGGARRRPAS